MSTLLASPSHASSGAPARGSQDGITYAAAKPDEAPPAAAPGDEAAPGSEGTGENVCPRCGGSGRTEGGERCEACGGTGTITEGIGGG
jgi:hypothetical protein